MNDREWMTDVARGSSNQLAGFIIGVAVGAGLALLMAPATGSDTRRRIGETAKRLGKDARGGLEHAGEALHDLGDEAKSAIETGRKVFQRGRQAAGSAMTEATEFGEASGPNRPSRV